MPDDSVELPPDVRRMLKAYRSLPVTLRLRDSVLIWDINETDLNKFFKTLGKQYIRFIDASEAKL